MTQTLDDVHADIMARLADGASNRQSPLHTPVIGSGDGDMRVMVLREFDAERRSLRFHTDSRSPKVGAIGGNGSPVGALFYDPAAKIQIRAKGVGRIEASGSAADAAWQESTTFARRCYLATSAPGDVSEAPVSGLPDWAEGIKPSEEQVAPARPNFAVLLIELQELDWLYLANSGHRRAQFKRASQHDEWSGQWVVP